MSFILTHDDYRHVMREYGAAIRRATGDKYLALTAKWQPDDIIPGLSDLDFRVVLTSDAAPDDWIAADAACGEIHQSLTREDRRFWRILEHPPGCGLTAAELTDEDWYHPEYRAWQVCDGDPRSLAPMRDFHAVKPWERRDELNHLKKFLDYYGPYREGIDPPINLGPYEPKYALHSTCWHYFAPPMFSAAALLNRGSFIGKREALTWLARQFPGVPAFEKVSSLAAAAYDPPDSAGAARPGDFDQELYSVFQHMCEPIKDSLSHYVWPADIEPADMKRRLATESAPEMTPMEIIDAVRFARIRLGRYLFYLDAPEGFDAVALLINELNWAGVIVRKPLQAAARFSGLPLDDSHPVEAVERVLRRSLDPSERRSLESIVDMARQKPVDEREARDAFTRCLDDWKGYYRLLEEFGRALIPGPIPSGQSALMNERPRP